MSKKQSGKVSLMKLGKDFLSMKKKYVALQRSDEQSVDGSVVVISGANSGIGEVAAMEMAKRHAQVVMCCRDLEKAEKVKKKIQDKFPHAKLDLIPLDLGNLASVRKCAKQIRQKYDHVNILINNAGVLYTDEYLYKTSDGFEIHMGINHLGNFLLTLLLLDLIQPREPTQQQMSGTTNRIIFVGSTAHLFAELDLKDLMLETRGKSFGKNNHGPYANSKLANMYFARELTKRLDGTGVLVTVLCPGYIKTDIFRNFGCFSKLKTNLGVFFFGSSVAEGADVILYCSLSTRLSEANGEMYRFNNVWPGAMDALDDFIGQELWDKSEKLVGLKK